MTMRTTQRLAMGFLLVLTACGDARGINEPPAARDYVDEFGGSRDAYQRILASDQCDELQVEYDHAADAREGSEPGTRDYRQATGYMKAAYDQMRTVGCSQS